MTEKKPVSYHFLLILLAASLWGTAGIFVRTAERAGLSEMQVVFIRALFSCVLLGGITLFKGRRLFRIALRDLPLFAGSGIFSIVMFNFCYYKTMALTSLSVAAVLLYTAPFFVVILSVFLFHERLTLKKCAACIVAFIGCCLVTGVFGSGTRLTAAAIGFGVLTGFGYALYTIFGRLLLDRGYASLTITFYTFLFALIGCLPFVSLPGVFSVVLSGWPAFQNALWMAVLNTVAPYLFYTAGLKGVSPSAAPVIAMAEPVVATLIGAAFFHERVTVMGGVGIALVVASVAVLNLKTEKRHETA